ncbi:MAG: hypothetical protein HDR92_10550 [Bacteroides sp.]|nr:hypothetical protein [Bacteroides sp.]
MKDKAFEAIFDFCDRNKLSKLHQRVLLHKYYEDYYVLIEDYRNKEKTEPSADTIKGFNSTLLNEMTLKTNVRLADDEIRNYTQKEIDKVTKKQSRKSFWNSVLTSIIGSFIYSVILLLLFTLAHNQVKSWIDDLYKNEQEINKTISEKSILEKAHQNIE